MGSLAGVLKTAAKRTGCTVEEYQAKEAAGLRWCCGCKAWHNVKDFSTDKSRGGGRGRTCRAWRNRNLAKVPEPIEKRRARRLVQMRVRRGKLPHPSTLPCTKCGMKASETGRRHDYHHHNGYSLEHRADVVPMCSDCHSQEEN